MGESETRTSIERGLICGSWFFVIVKVDQECRSWERENTDGRFGGH